MAAFHAHVAYRPHHLAHTDAGRKLHDAIAGTVGMVRTWHLRASVRRELRALNDHLLADIGMRRADVNKPFWQA